MNIEDTEKQYEDIIHLPHHTSTKYPRMSLLSRAAQFSPFDANNMAKDKEYGETMP